MDYFENGKLEGFVGVCRENDIIIYNVNGQVYLEIPEAHNGEIIGMYITKENKDNNDDKNNKDLVLISAGKDGRIKFWKI